MANKLDGFRPIGDLILIKRDESLKMTKGGLYLSEQSQEQLCTGYVVAVGEGNFHKGERVQFEDHIVTGKQIGRAHV